MEMITINNRDIQINITKKNNKNTYFYFKKDGYIQINLSKYQTKKQALDFIKNNSEHFLKKLDKVQKRYQTDDSIYYYFGTPLEKILSSEVDDITLTDHSIILPDISIDQLDIMLKKFEKKQMMNILQKIHHKYRDNGYVNIQNITLKTRYTTTRFGSCNAFKRNINMSTYLMHYDVKYIEYVFLHEISHLLHQNHGPKFYKLLEKLCPNHNQLKRELNQQFKR